MEVKYFLEKLFHNIRYNQKVQLGIFVGFLILSSIIVWAGIAYSILNTENQSVADTHLPMIDEKEEVLTGIIARRLDGMMVDATGANKQPVAIMIENLASGEVRPQHGLSRALVVYEVIVEGGITRFMALFAGEDASQIGPVRSARPTYLEFASEYDALYTHAGGSPEALGAIDGLGIKDLNALTGSRFFWRDTSKFAPHNLYTSSELIGFALRDMELEDEKVQFESWKFRDPKNLDDRTEEEKNIKVIFSTPSYDVEWKYDRENNNYTRTNGGVLQVDPATNETLTAKNIVVQSVPEALSAGEKGRVNFNVTGSGKVYVFREGEIVEGTWEKKDRLTRTKFYDENNQEIELVRGNTWIEILPEDSSLEYN
ncbi:MAG: DUF3048 domain-containing protein [Patescibacteria group bacterium]